MVLASTILVLLAPLMAIVAIAIRLESSGPIFFRQVREGFNGTKFEILKFRSMYADDSDFGAKRQTSRGDARVTRVGRFIRRFSIDELPQLLNVLSGSMSVVGPRPHALQTSPDGNALSDLVSYYAARHRMKPGLTGWAQVSGLRGELDSIQKLRSRVDADLYYIKNWSVILDLEIVFLTIPKVLFPRDAY